MTPTVNPALPPLATKVLALAAPRHSSARALALLRVLGTAGRAPIRVVSFRYNQAAGGPTPDAVLATSVIALPVLPDVPVAVWVDRPDDLAQARRSGAVAVLSNRPELVDEGALFVPREGVDVARWPAIAPLVRARWRERFGLPDDVVVGVDPPLPERRPEGSLALASAAVVVGDLTPLALALGTPVVTSQANAKRFGLRPGVDVEVASSPQAAHGEAEQVAADPAHASFLSRRGRRTAERLLDVGAPARRLLPLLDLEVPPLAGGVDVPDPRLRTVARLEELGVGERAPLRARVDDALDLFALDLFAVSSQEAL